MYVYTYTYSQRLSPRLLWVPKFDFKLGCSGHEFQNYPIIATFLKFDVKSMLFFFNLSIIFDFSEFCFQKCVFQKHPTMVTKKKGQNIFFLQNSNIITTFQNIVVKSVFFKNTLLW